MATITTFINGKQPHEVLQGQVGFHSEILDFSKTNCSSGDVVQAISVQENTLILEARTRVLTAEGSTATADFGDGDDPNGFGDACDFNASANTIEKALEADAYGIGRYYSEDDTIDLTLDNDLSTAKIEVSIVYATPRIS